MKKTVNLETTAYEINVEDLAIEIKNKSKSLEESILNVKIEGKVADKEKAMEIAEKYIDELEWGGAEYADISSAFIPGTIKEYRMDTGRSQDADERLGVNIISIIESFLAEDGDEVKVFFSTVNEKRKKDYVLFEGGNVEALIGNNFLKISKGVAEFKSHSGEIQKIIKNLAEFSEHLSEKNQKAFSNLIA